MNSNIEREIKAAKDKAQYDARAKRLLGNKYILAYILQEAVAEFKEESVQTIIGCIENDIRISSVSVEPGETNAERNMEQITGNNTEDKVPDEGTIYFDIMF
ncbi:MAG: hypothetical protein K2O03_09670, partial [Lachnospiraceae bacterium]|nr:hypothetical protein [Lachnospiraceae bacterium]